MKYSNLLRYTVKNKKLGYLKILSQLAKADFWVFSTYFLGNFSTFCCINLKQEVEKTQKSAEAGCLKILSLPNFFFFFYSVVNWWVFVKCEPKSSQLKEPKT